MPQYSLPLNPVQITAETPITNTSQFGSKKILTTATIVNAAGIDLPNRKSVMLQNNSMNAIYISNRITVSKTEGILIAPGAVTTINTDPNVVTPIYAVSIGVASIVSILEV